MCDIKRYNKNLLPRLEQLRNGDPAYHQHFLAIAAMIVYAGDLHDHEKSQCIQCILDVGCGLGFLTAMLTKLKIKAVGIDPSQEAITLAQIEHPHVQFFPETALKFAKKMHSRGIDLFDQAVLNMVLHSVNDATILEIFSGIKQCLIPGGTLLLLVPARTWLQQKLIEYVQDKDMNREEGIMWVYDQLQKKEVELPIKIKDGEPWPEPILIFNRTLDDYGSLLQKCGFGVVINNFHAETNKFLGSQIIPYWELDDYIVNIELMYRQRHLLMSFVLIDER